MVKTKESNSPGLRRNETKDLNEIWKININGCGPVFPRTDFPRLCAGENLSAAESTFRYNPG